MEFEIFKRLTSQRLATIRQQTVTTRVTNHIKSKKNHDDDSKKVTGSL